MWKLDSDSNDPDVKQTKINNDQVFQAYLTKGLRYLVVEYAWNQIVEI